MTLGSPLRFGASTSLSIEDPPLTRLSGPMSATTSAPTVNNSITRSIVLDNPGRWTCAGGFKISGRCHSLPVAAESMVKHHIVVDLLVVELEVAEVELAVFALEGVNADVYVSVDVDGHRNNGSVTRHGMG